MWSIDGDFVADDIEEETIGDIDYEEWDHEDIEGADQINLLDYEKIQYDLKDDKNEVEWTEESNSSNKG